MEEGVRPRHLFSCKAIGWRTTSTDRQDTEILMRLNYRKPGVTGNVHEKECRGFCKGHNAAAVCIKPQLLQSLHRLSKHRLRQRSEFRFSHRFMDKLTAEQRHRCMAAIRSRDTKPELVVRRFLFGRGFRYRLNDPRLPGHPDLVLRKYRTVIFVNGCFWHGHEGCKYFVLPKSNVKFWKNKIERNRHRDAEEQRKLAAMGWHSITVWECQLKPKVRHRTLEALVYTLCHIYLEDIRIKPYGQDENGCRMVAEPELKYGKKQEGEL